ncbi:HdeD family acid-resistance protein [Mycolicibacterium mengxianglii]|uniref:HdeD family acid-resistance protein n=1 Tax=Mycolicibacterium mengxianglii TaxID=2736649 RepID=UPI001E40F30A|nr:HdeD family acid-resistance protein [Mycolicibacterium mengxianglii]
MCHTARMETTTAPSLLPHLWKSTLVSGVLVTLFGIAVVVWPGISILVAAIFFGAYLLVTGIAQVVLAFSLRAPTGSKVLLFISGLASVILGVLCFLSLADSILLLAIWIGIGFIFRGVATTASAISDKTLPGRGWEIFFGVVSLIAGIVLMVMPFESLATLALVVGIWLIVTGVFEIVMAFGIRRGSKALGI